MLKKLLSTVVLATTLSTSLMAGNMEDMNYILMMKNLKCESVYENETASTVKNNVLNYGQYWIKINEGNNYLTVETKNHINLEDGLQFYFFKTKFLCGKAVEFFESNK